MKGDEPRRILVINPNTNAQVTSLVRNVAEDLAVEGIITSVVNPEAGPISIESLTDRSIAEPRVIEIIRKNDGYDGFVIACFDDLALKEARQIVSVPVVGAFSASIEMTSHFANRFSIVTTYDGAVVPITALVKRFYPRVQFTVRAAGIGVAEAASSGLADKKLCGAIHDAIKEDEAEAVILGSGGLAGKVKMLSPQFEIPIVDAVGAGISMCQAMVRMNISRRKVM